VDQEGPGWAGGVPTPADGAGPTPAAHTTLPE